MLMSNLKSIFGATEMELNNFPQHVRLYMPWHHGTKKQKHGAIILQYCWNQIHGAADGSKPPRSLGTCLPTVPNVELNMKPPVQPFFTFSMLRCLYIFL